MSIGCCAWFCACPSYLPPRYKLAYRKQHFKSEPIKKTLMPRWPEHWLSLGYVCQSDAKKVCIKVEDWDRFTDNDFMGRVSFPAGCCFMAGPGEHTWSMPLQRRCVNVCVSV